MISAAFILYAAAPHAWVWALLRVLVGFCFAGVYVVAESWLNDAATNETRGQALSLYMIVQMVGIISAQGILNLADPGGYTLFVVMSVLVSVAFLPILLTAGTVPPFQTTKPMSLRQLFAISPLGCIGTFLLGGVFAAIFGMASVFGTQAGMSVAEISIFVSAIYFGGLVFQYPIGWVSDRMDRRVLIMGLTAAGALATAVGGFFTDSHAVTLALGLVIGGVANPLYSLIIAYTNDFLQPPDMAAASGGLLFINGLGSMAGPVIIGAAMTRFGAGAFFAYVGVLYALIALYALYRMSKRPTPDETSPYNPGPAPGLAGRSRGRAGRRPRARSREPRLAANRVAKRKYPGHTDATAISPAGESARHFGRCISAHFGSTASGVDSFFLTDGSPCGS